jgi:acetolactate decarboxylase
LNGITQVATIDALLSGVYDGHMSLGTLRRHGDFGIGTFEAMDGEMILLDGKFYKIRVDGKVYRPALSERTPFASVTAFVPDSREKISGPTGMKALEAKVNALVPQANRFCALRVHGVFKSVRTRSVPLQTKPYPPLLEVTKNQPVFTFSNVRGTLLGFRSPAFVKGVNIPGYHLHFLADDLSGGGHVLDYEVAEGTIEADTVNEWLRVYLPASESFGAADLAKDRVSDLQSVEKDMRSGSPGKPVQGDGK